MKTLFSSILGLIFFSITASQTPLQLSPEQLNQSARQIAALIILDHFGGANITTQRIMDIGKENVPINELLNDPQLVDVTIDQLLQDPLWKGKIETEVRAELPSYTSDDSIISTEEKIAHKLSQWWTSIKSTAAKTSSMAQTSNLQQSCHPNASQVSAQMANQTINVQESYYPGIQSASDTQSAQSPATAQQPAVSSSASLPNSQSSSVHASSARQELDDVVCDIARAISKNRSANDAEAQQTTQTLLTCEWKKIIKERMMHEQSDSNSGHNILYAKDEVIRKNREFIPSWPPQENPQQQPAASATSAASSTTVNPTQTNAPAIAQNPSSISEPTHWFYKRPKMYVAIGIAIVAICGYFMYLKAQQSKQKQPQIV